MTSETAQEMSPSRKELEFGSALRDAMRMGDIEIARILANPDIKPELRLRGINHVLRLRPTVDMITIRRAALDFATRSPGPANETEALERANRFLEFMVGNPAFVLAGEPPTETTG